MAALCDIFVHDAFGTAHRAEASTYGIAQYRQGRLRRPAAGGRDRRHHQGAGAAQAPAGGHRRRLQGSAPSSPSSRPGRQRRPADRGRRHRQHLHARRRPADRQVAGRSRPGGRGQGRDRGDEGARRGGADPHRRGRGQGLRRRCAGDREGRERRGRRRPDPRHRPADGRRCWPRSCAAAGTIVWNGPVGVFEFDAFAQRHRDLARAIADSRRPSASPAAATRWPPSPSTASRQDVGYISTGGGAFLEVLEGKTLPAFEILEQRAAG